MIINITNVNWLYGDKLSYKSSNPVEEDKLDSVCRFSVDFTIDNVGDFPYFLGYEVGEVINLDCLIELLKMDNGNSIFSSDIINIERYDVEYSGPGWRNETYLASGKEDPFG